MVTPGVHAPDSPSHSSREARQQEGARAWVQLKGFPRAVGGPTGAGGWAEAREQGWGWPARAGHSSVHGRRLLL